MRSRDGTGTRCACRALSGEDVEELEFENYGVRTVVKVILPERRNVKKGHAKLEIRVPRGSRVEAEGVSADVSADDVRGGLVLSSVSGDIEISGEPEQVRGESVSGRHQYQGPHSPDHCAEREWRCDHSRYHGQRFGCLRQRGREGKGREG